MNLIGKIINPLGTIPEKYRDEFISERICLIKARVALLCFLSLLINVIASSLSFVFYPKDFDPKEIPLWILMVLVIVLLLSINKRVRTMFGAKSIAYVYTLFMLLIVIKSSVIYYYQAELSAPIFMFVLFLIALTIPWRPLEIIPITLLHAGGFLLLFLFFKRYFNGVTRFGSDMLSFYDGIIFLVTGFAFCLVIKANEMQKDITTFLLFKETESQKRQMQRELELATRVHNTLIPKSISTDRVAIAVTYLPMQYIGGDYTKFHFLDKDRVLFIICDVTGHGVSAALLVNRFHAEFERLAKLGKEPGILLKELNDFIIEEFDGTHMFLSAFACMLDFKEKKMTYSNHGHPPQYLYQIHDGSLLPLEPQGSLMGVFPENNGVYQHEIGFDSGDRILLFTDGVVETRAASGELFGNERLEEIIQNTYSEAVSVFNASLLKKLNSFKDGPFQDDVLVVNIGIE